MAITAALVKELRERTGAPMMDCKKALTKVDGDIELAIEEMRKAGLTKADKKAGRTAAEGIILIKISENKQQAALLELNCETDFVAKDTNFVEFAKGLVDKVLQEKVESAEQLLGMSFDGKSTCEEALKALIAKIGENMTLRRAECFATEQGEFTQYIHGGKIGVLVHTIGATEELAKDIAMHVAASNPRVILPEEFPEQELAKEREIFEAKSQDSGKPVEIIEKMIAGQINKFLSQVSLTGQPFVKDPDVTVGQLLKTNKAEVKRFLRYEVGEGIEKEVTDFAQEVMAQVRGSA